MGCLDWLGANDGQEEVVWAVAKRVRVFPSDAGASLPASLLDDKIG